MINVKTHYDLLIDENNDPVHDPKPLQDYMDKWDGQEFIDKMQLNDNKTVLEIGVGTGRLAVRTAPLCNQFYGIDISPKTIDRAEENLARFSNTTLICDDFLYHEFNKTFDVIYSSLTFMHIKEKQKAINKVSDLLNVGGKFILSMDKSQNKFIEYGTRTIEIYPDNSEQTGQMIIEAGLTLLDRYETEFAAVFVAQK